MIGIITGTVVHIDTKNIIIMTSGGVGYEVNCSGALLSEAQMNKPITCYISTIVRETEISLYGFSTIDEKKIFLKLLTVSGVGPKMGIQIISSSPERLYGALDSEDTDFLTSIPGVGNKLAQKLILELRGKLSPISTPTTPATPALSEAIVALENLGYNKGQIEKVFASPPENLHDTEDFVKFFLSHR